MQVEVALPNNKKISAGYGDGGKGKAQDARLVGKLAEEVGLRVVLNNSQGNSLVLFESTISLEY